MICDSNILIYAAEPGDTLCLPYAQRSDAMIASVTRIEMLGFPKFGMLSPQRQTQLQTLLLLQRSCLWTRKSSSEPSNCGSRRA